MFNARVLADTISPNNARLTTLELTFPRVILAEFNTHRMLSRNAASSRAIPTEKLIQRVIDDPFIPEFRENKKGMQAGESLSADDSIVARDLWLHERDHAVAKAREMHGLNIHKQYINRLLEPWMWVTVIASATDWANVWKLRCHPDAEPSFQKIATMARAVIDESTPFRAGIGHLHLPLFGFNAGFGQDDLSALPELSMQYAHSPMTQKHLAKLISVGRCARVSYLTHDGVRDPAADIELALRLATSGHWSPFEHVASWIDTKGYSGNFYGWQQFRKSFNGECEPEARR